MNRTYPLGDPVLMSATFINTTTNQPANPSNVVLRLRDPNNTEVRPAVTNAQIGIFNSRFVPMIPGIWHARWEGSGVIVAVIENEFEVKPSVFATG